MHLICMTKARTTITIDKDLLKKAKEMGINVSAFLDIKLREYIALVEGKGVCSEDSKSTEYLINEDSLYSSRARSLARIGRQPPKL